MVDTIREHSDLVVSLTQSGCESMLPPGPLNNERIQKLADDLIQAEKWDLALEVHLNFGFSIDGIMPAQGLAALKAGCYETGKQLFIFISKILI